MFKMTFKDFDICHGLRKLQLVAQTSFSRYNITKCKYSVNGESQHKKCALRLLQILTFVIERRHCESCSPSPWPTFLRTNISNINISLITQLAQKCAIHRMQIFCMPSNTVFAKGVLRDLVSICGQPLIHSSFFHFFLFFVTGQSSSRSSPDIQRLVQPSSSTVQRCAAR